MKHYIEQRLTTWSDLYKSPESVLSNLFCTLGTGNNLDRFGYLEGNHVTEEVYPFGDPAPLTGVYPWTATEKYQPFRKLAGCRDLGFREAVEYFIECVKLTPDTLPNIGKWKDNLELLRSVLLDTPELRGEYEDCKSEQDMQEIFLKKLESDTKESETNSVRKEWFFDVQCSDCPKFVEDEIIEMWSERNLFNDYCIIKTEIDPYLKEWWPNVYLWLKHKGVKEGELVIIHWWW